MTTNQQQIDNFFDFEREKHSSFFLPYYKENNWKVLEDNIDGNVPISWDVKLQYENSTTNLVDEKARTTDYGDCVIEFIQDVPSQSWGWYYGKKDVILYANWKDPKSKNPSSFHSIRMSKLHEYIDNLNRQTFKTLISNQGYGLTFNIVISWQTLIDNGVSKKLPITGITWE